MRLKTAFLTGVALLCLTELAAAQSFDQLIGFGDSATDTGWFTGATSGPRSTGISAFDNAIAAAIAAGANGHWTGPGPGNAQILGSFFGLSVSEVGMPGGTNYAIGAAVDFMVPPSLSPLTGNSSFPNPLLPGTATQIENYLASVGGRANPNALYLISSGGNDIGVAAKAYFGNVPAATTYLLGEAQALANSIAQLQADGARTIILSNYYPGPTDTPGSVFLGNIILTAQWHDLAAAGVNFIPADTQSVFRAVEANLPAYGIQFPISSYACIAPPLITTGYGILCPPSQLVAPDATKTHLFVDGLHLTEAGQIIEADYFYNLLVAPTEISFLPEAALLTTFQTIRGAREQIDDPAQRTRPPGWNAWANGAVSYLKLDNSTAGFPGDPGYPVSGSMGVDYKWASGWFAGAALTTGYVNPTFSLGGGYTQDSASLSLYAARREANWWGDIVGTAAWLNYDTNRLVPIGMTVQPNNGSTTGFDLSLAGQAGYDVHTGAATHGPVAGFILQQAQVNGFAESGSYTSLSFGRQVRNSEVSALGYQVRFDWGMWHPFVEAVWNHEFDALDRVVTTSLTTIAAPSYTMPAVVLGRDWATATVGTRFSYTRAWRGIASFTTQLGQDHATVLGGLIGVAYAFGVPAAAPVLYKK